jgi:hypothetical protein
MIPSGVQKSVIFAPESTWGTKPAANTGKYKRRVKLELDLNRDTYESAEISSTAQTSDMRSGMNKIEGTLSGELSAGSYADEIANLLRGIWTAGVTNTATTIAAAATGNKFVRSSGSWISLGFKVGDYVNVSGFTTTAVANNKRWTVLSVTATDLVVSSDTLVVTKAEGDSVTVAVPGKKLSIPLAPGDRTDNSFTVEQFFQGVNLSEVYTGCKTTSLSADVKPSAMVTVEFGILGKGVETGTAQYFTTPAAASVTSPLSGSSGALYLGGAKVATVTSLTFEVQGNMEAGEIIGSRDAAAIFLGRITASGEITAYFENHTLFNSFVNETELSLTFVMTGNGTEAISVTFPRIKLGGAGKSDEETGGTTQSIPFTALLPTGVDTTVDQSTVTFIDTSLV